MEKEHKKDIIGTIVAEAVQSTYDVLEEPSNNIDDSPPSVVELRKHFKGLPEGLYVEETRNEVHLFAKNDEFTVCIVVLKDHLPASAPYVPADKFLFLSKDGEYCIDINTVLRKAFPNAREGISMNFLNPNKFSYFASRTCGFPTSLEDIFAVMHEYGHQARRKYTDSDMIEMDMPFRHLLPTIVEDETEAWDIAYLVLGCLRDSRYNFIHFEDKHFLKYRESSLKSYDDFHRENIGLLRRLSSRYRFTAEGKAETLKVPRFIRAILNIWIERRRERFEQRIASV